LINEIYFTNKKKITDEIGFTVITGKTIFSMGKFKNLKDRYIFKEHQKYIMVVDIKNQALDFQSFIHNE